MNNLLYQKERTRRITVNKTCLGKCDLAILAAIEAGYTATKKGKILRINGTEVVGSINNSGYRCTTINSSSNDSSKHLSILFHRFIAAFFFGREALEAQCIRHLNDVKLDNRLENLMPGTMKDNRGDLDPRIISFNAKKHAAELVNRQRKLSDKDIIAMREERFRLKTPYYKLGPKFGVTTMTAQRCCVGTAWK